MSAVHQVCTYKALRAVPLRSLDRHRLHLLLDSYVGNNFQKILVDDNSGCREAENAKDFSSTLKAECSKSLNVLTPSEVAEKESFLPMVTPDDSVRWLEIGPPLTVICPSLEYLEMMLLPKNDSGCSIADVGSGEFDSEGYEKYILRVHLPTSPSNNLDNDGSVQLTFLEGATDTDLLRGMFHAYIARAYVNCGNGGQKLKFTYDMESCDIAKRTHSIMNKRMVQFLDHLQQGEWQMGSGFVNVECGSSNRFALRRQS